jgi:hypothetical protein
MTLPSSDAGRPQGSGRPQGQRWTREQIRAARQVPLLPLLRRHALEYIELPGGNFQLRAYPGLLIKESYWRWPERDLAGNAIDFFVEVLGRSFNDAMREITAAQGK